MEPIITYLLKSGGIMLFVLIAYYVLLRGETFYRHNRFFLIIGLVLSVVLPLITFSKKVLVEAETFAVTEIPQIVQKIPASVAVETETINWFQIISWIYLTGATVFLFIFILDLFDLRKMLSGKAIVKSENLKLIEVDGNIAPFSYFNYIVYNPKLYTAIELSNIMEHEKVHCRQMHSVDVIVSRMYCILFWFNPFAWLYKKTIVQNLEFIADNEASGKTSDRLSYQITLVKVTAHENCVAITNHFYQSLIKKRIVMLNKNQSKKVNQLKYGILIPAVTAFMLQFQVDVIAQSKHITSKGNNVATATFSNDDNVKIDAIMVLPQTTDAELKSYEKRINTDYGMEMKFSNIVRNKKKEILRFDFWYDDKVNVPQTISVYKTDTKAIFFMINIAKDKNGKETIKLASYDNNEKNSGLISAEAIVLTDEPENPLKEKANYLIVTDDGEFMSDELKGKHFLVDGSIKHLNKEEARKKYGAKAKDGALVVLGTYEIMSDEEFQKNGFGKAATLAATGQESKVITTEKGDEVIFFKGGKVKVPGNPTIDFDNGTQLIIDGVIYHDPKSVIENMDLDRIKNAYINEIWDANDKKTLQLVMKLK